MVPPPARHAHDEYPGVGIVIRGPFRDSTRSLRDVFLRSALALHAMPARRARGLIAVSASMLGVVMLAIATLLFIAVLVVAWGPE